jgi:hypothetical protein
VHDRTGNTSAPGTVEVHVDAARPVVRFTDCPAGVVAAGSAVLVHWIASDGDSGVAGAGSGSFALDTKATGKHHADTPPVADNVGHAAAPAGCDYAVGYDFDGFYGLSETLFNRIQPNSPVALRFSLDGPAVFGEHDSLGLGVLAVSPLKVTSVACPPKRTLTADVWQREHRWHTQTLVYNRFSDSYRYLWAPDKRVMRPGTCWSVQLTFDDGTKSPEVRFLVK